MRRQFPAAFYIRNQLFIFFEYFMNGSCLSNEAEFHLAISFHYSYINSTRTSFTQDQVCNSNIAHSTVSIIYTCCTLLEEKWHKVVFYGSIDMRLNVYIVPCKHATSFQYRVCTGPMLAGQAQYRPVLAHNSMFTGYKCSPSFIGGVLTL